MKGVNSTTLQGNSKKSNGQHKICLHVNIHAKNNPRDLIGLRAFSTPTSTSAAHIKKEKTIRIHDRQILWNSAVENQLGDEERPKRAGGHGQSPNISKLANQKPVNRKKECILVTTFKILSSAISASVAFQP
jgi:hypothetical protein